VASFVFDHAAVHSVLLQRLRRKSPQPFVLDVHVDAAMLRTQVSRLQKSRLKSLHSAGANVWLCTGQRGLGTYHVKGVVVDRRYLYAGSSNITAKSIDNQEWCFRMTGPVVDQVLSRLALDRSNRRHELWDGR
jgi:phosphatidylserine/phosphatidylglycerophosphate/cardiolipin synthase-like enzyme